MKEYISQGGGRHTFVDDFTNLQDLALSMTSIFAGCGNFVVSGCERNGNQVNAGYVFIKNKLRHLSVGATITGATGPLYLVEANETENVPYASGAPKTGRMVYGVRVTKDKPTTEEYIEIPVSGGARTIKDALFGKYALLTSPSANSQLVHKPVSFKDAVSIEQNLALKGSQTFATSGKITSFGYLEGKFSIACADNSGKSEIALNEDGTIGFYLNDAPILSIANGRVRIDGEVVATSLSASNVCIKESDIYEAGTTSDEGTLNINVLGLRGTDANFRNTVIGNGKGEAIININGASNTVDVESDRLNIKGDFTLYGKAAKNDVAYIQSVFWKDNANDLLGFVGYNSIQNSNLDIENHVGSINILSRYNGGIVNIGPSIMENGVLLSEKYALAKNAPKLNSFLADMVNGNEDNKRTIRANIGAVSYNDIPKVRDTGWIAMLDTIQCRQYGSVVQVVGSIKTPNLTTSVVRDVVISSTFEYPKVNIPYHYAEGSNYISGYITTGGVLRITSWSGTGITFPISITYIAK